MNVIRKSNSFNENSFDEFICNGKVGVGRNFRIKEILKSEYYKNATTIVLNFNDEWDQWQKIKSLLTS